MDAACLCVAGAALGAPQAHFAWQAQHLQYLSLILHGRCSTRSTSTGVGGSPATSEYYGRRLLLRSRARCSTWSTSGSFCVAGAPLAEPPQRSAEVRRQVSAMDAGCFCVGGAAHGAPQACFAWQVQHLEHLQKGQRKSGNKWRRLPLRGRCSTWSASGSFCVAGATLAAPQCHFAWQVQHSEDLGGRRKSGHKWVLRTPAAFAWQVQHLEHLRLLLRGALQAPFAWQGQHFEHLHICRRRKSGDEWCEWAPLRFAWQAQHLEHLRLVLRGRRSARITSS